MISYPRSAIVGVLLGYCLWVWCPGTAVAQWYSGGTLHAANGLAWQQAEVSNRLATAADMVAAVAKVGDTTLHYRTGDDLRPYAEQLAACITEATKTRAASTLPVQNIAAL
jgi:hypothetical protein